MQTDGTIVIFYKDQITISANILDCPTSLTENISFLNPNPILYNSVGSYITIINSYTDIFNHQS